MSRRFWRGFLFFLLRLTLLRARVVTVLNQGFIRADEKDDATSRGLESC